MVKQCEKVWGMVKQREVGWGDGEKVFELCPARLHPSEFFTVKNLAKTHKNSKIPRNSEAKFGNF